MPTKPSIRFALPELLDRLAADGGRGRLTVGIPDAVIAEVWFDRGLVVDARAEAGDERLGARLLSAGYLSPDELKRAEKAARKEGGLRKAVGAGVPFEVLHSIVRDEARYALAAALTVSDDELSFEEGADPPSAPLAVDPSALVNETRAFLAALVPAQAYAPADAVPRATGLQPDELTLVETAVYSRCDGVRTVAQLADECGLPQPEVSVFVERLAAAGLIAVDALAGAHALIAELEAATMDLSSAEPDDFEELPGPPTLVVSEPSPPPPPPPEAKPAAPEPKLIAPVPLQEAARVPEAPAAPPPPHVPAPAPVAETEARVDTIALLRELSSLSRDADGGRR